MLMWQTVYTVDMLILKYIKLDANVSKFEWLIWPHQHLNEKKIPH